MPTLSLEQWGLPSPQRPIVIAGPCSAESEEQMLATARGLAGSHVSIFRAGIWKPRTRPGSFEGYGSVALDWLRTVKKETGLWTAGRGGLAQACLRGPAHAGGRALDRRAHQRQPPSPSRKWPTPSAG